MGEDKHGIGAQCGGHFHGASDVGIRRVDDSVDGQSGFLCGLQILGLLLAVPRVDLDPVKARSRKSLNLSVTDRSSWIIAYLTAILMRREGVLAAWHGRAGAVNASPVEVRKCLRFMAYCLQ